MNKKEVGTIVRFSVDEQTEDLFITIKVTDPKFKKKFLRDLYIEKDIVLKNKKLYTEE
jgi:hypothetical protein